jgi:hypothetical protein
VEIGVVGSNDRLRVAYNSVDDEYLVVWGSYSANSNTTKGQRIDAATGLEVGADDFPIPLGIGPSGLAYNPTDDQYLAVRELSPGQTLPVGVVYGARVAGDGTIVDASPVTLVSDGGIEVHAPAVAYAPELGRYLLVWSRGLQTCCEGSEVRGALLDHATLATIGAAFEVDLIGAPGDTHTGAYEPQVAWDAGATQFVAAFFGSDDTAGDGTNDAGHIDEVFAQRVAGDTGATVCSNAFRVSDRDPSTNLPANRPAWSRLLALGVVPSTGQSVVLWNGEYQVGPPGYNDSDVYGDLFPRGCAS